MPALRSIGSLAASAALVIVGCTTGGSPPVTGGSPSVGTSMGTDDTPLDTMAIRARVKWNDGSRFALLSPHHGEVITLETDGVLTRDGSLFVGIDHRGDATPVTTWDMRRDEKRLLVGPTGNWGVASVGIAGRPTGLTADDHAIVLVDLDSVDSRRFAVVPLDEGRASTILEYEPRFTYDAVSPDGRVLYLVETLGGDDPLAYVVRASDVSTGGLRDGIIVDKRNLEVGAMSGRPIDQTAGDSGWVYTLYQGTHHAFVHALSTTDASAVCIDLPDGGAPGGEDDDTAAPAWTLRFDEARGRLYAANGALGTVVAIDVNGNSVVREVDLAPLRGSAAGATTTARPIAGAAVVTSDATTLWVAMAHGLAAVDLETFEARGPDLVDRSVRSLARASDAGSVLALDTDGEILRLEATTGELLASRVPKVGLSIVELLDGDRP